MLKKTLRVLTLAVFLFSLSPALQAEEENKDFTGQFSFGYRSVGTSGASEKYKEDINLESGIRLFNLSFNYTPSGALKNLVDRVTLDMSNFGGDPFESLMLTANKFGRYSLKYSRKKAEYFYNDMYDTGGGHLYDLHTFDFERVMDTGSFTYDVSKFAQVFLSFDRYTKMGDSATTFDINRIEFEFDKPIREKYASGALGLDLHTSRYSFFYEYRITDYETENSLFLPGGYTDGGDSARYPSALSLFFINQPYDLNTDTHLVKATARPFGGLIVNGVARLSNQEMNLTYAETQQGIDYYGNSFTFGASGKADFSRKINLYDVDLTWLLSNKFAVIGAYRQHDFDQSGTFSALTAESDSFGYSTTGIEAGLQYQFSRAFGLTVGGRTETRNLDNLETVLYEEKTTRNGLFGNLKWRFSKALDFALDYQRGYYNNPYTLISPSVQSRARATARFRLDGWNVNASFLRSRIFNDLEADWETVRYQINLRAGYHGAKVKVFGGYSYFTVSHQGDRSVAYPPAWSGGPGTFDWIIDYEGKASLVDLSLSLKLDESMNIGAYANLYSNTGFWEISRTMIKAYVERVFTNGFVGQIGYRYVDFSEKLAKDNDYKAGIFEIAFGYRWK